MVILIWNDITSGCRSSNKTLLQVTSPLLASNNLDQLMKQNFSLSFQPSSWNKKTKVQKPSPIWGWLHHLRWASPRILRWKCEIIQPFYAFPKTTRDLSQVTVFRAISNWKAASTAWGSVFEVSVYSTKSNAALQAWAFQPPTSKTFDDGALTNKTFEQEKATLEKDTEIPHQTTLYYGLNPTKTQYSKELVSLGKPHS